MRRGERYPLADRFWRRVICMNDDTRCWHWTGARQPGSYGTIRDNGTTKVAHRVSYEIAHGVKLDSRVTVCHACDNRICVNPNHLWLGTIGLNNADRHQKGRSRGGSLKGNANPMSKLSEYDVREIRSSSDPLAVVAAQFGIRFQTVSDIRRRRTWKHV